MPVQHSAKFRMLLSKLNCSLLKRSLLSLLFIFLALLHYKGLDVVLLNGLKCDLGVELRLGLQIMVQLGYVVIVLEKYSLYFIILIVTSAKA